MSAANISKNCIRCEQNFEIEIQDQLFYKKMEVPIPSHCPDCRQQRRLAWRNERTLYQRACDNCNINIVSIYDNQVQFPVFCMDCWWKDNWDGKNHSKDYDFKKPFFEQFFELQQKVPRMALMQFKNENSPFTNCVAHLKNCHMLFSADFNHDCVYGVWIEKSQDCVDNLLIDACQLSYECIFSLNLYNCIYVVNSSQCSDSAFLYDCRNCSNCFMSSGLRNKQYVIQNKQYSRDDYFKVMSELKLSSHKTLEALKLKFQDLINQAPHLYMSKTGSVIDSTGNYLMNLTNCKDCYEILDSKDCKYVQGGFEILDAYDGSYIGGELGYENCECVPMGYNTRFNINTYGGSNLTYVDLCMSNCSNLFGCVGLKKEEFCILNKQYSKEEYEELIPRIIEHMKSTGEWGEFYPIEKSIFAYNETVAQDFFPLSKEQIQAENLRWKEKQVQKVTQTHIPDDISEIDESILEAVLGCQKCEKGFKIIAKELNFYKKMNLPIPRNCPECRHQKRAKERNNRHLQNKYCFECSQVVSTTITGTDSTKIYCEKCYLNLVN